MKLNRWSFDNEDDLFRRFFYLSCALHIIVVASMTVKTSFFPSQDLLIQSAVRVDMVGLPDLPTSSPPPPAAPEPKPEPKPEPPPPPPKPEPAPQPKPKPEPQPKPKPKPEPQRTEETAQAQRRALERLQAQQAIERMQQEAQARAAQEQQAAQQRQAQEPTFRGNVIATGSSFTGLERLDYERYYDDLKIHLQNHWDLPQWLADAGFRASVVVKIDERGYVTFREIYESSGNSTFDNSALSAVQSASPFPEPPDRLKSGLQNSLLHFRFPE